eukprot:453886_1
MTHVMKLYSAFLLVIFNAHFVESQLIGTYGQSCSYGIDDTPFATPNGCDSAGETISENRAMECPENFDCCMCGTMICGNPDTGGCDELNCNGDSGCFGVQDIQIYGGAEGALISCNGDQSCNGTKITGRNIAEIGCTGDGACARSTFIFNCLHEEPCLVSCVGDGACAGNKDYNPGDSGEGDGDHLTTFFNIENTAGIDCSAEACQYGYFNLRNNIGGGMIACTGYGACMEAEITINNIESVICGAAESCKDANFLIIDPQEDFSVECSATDSCSGLSIEVVVTNGVDFFKEINCGGFGCVGAKFMIYNFGEQFINVEILGCEAPSACAGAVFDLDGGIGFEECKCGEDYTKACDGISGIDSCLSGVEKVECSGVGSCNNLQQAIANIANDFELICSDPTACKGFWLMIVLNTNAREPVNFVKGYKCDSDEACLNAIIQLNNEQDGVSVVVDKIDCGGVSSCENARFIVSGDVVINEIVCNEQSCDNCVVENMSSNTKIPCASF